MKQLYVVRWEIEAVVLEAMTAPLTEAELAAANARLLADLRAAVKERDAARDNEAHGRTVFEGLNEILREAGVPFSTVNEHGAVTTRGFVDRVRVLIAERDSALARVAELERERDIAVEARALACQSFLALAEAVAPGDGDVDFVDEANGLHRRLLQARDARDHAVLCRDAALEATKVARDRYERLRDAMLSARRLGGLSCRCRLGTSVPCTCGIDAALAALAVTEAGPAKGAGA